MNVELTCVECDDCFEVESPEEGETIFCTECGIPLCVVSIKNNVVELCINEDAIEDWGQ